MSRRVLGRAMPVLVLLGLLLVWEAGCWLFAGPEFVLPRPSRVVETLASNVGIGTLVEQASANFRIPLVFAELFVVVAMGVAMYAIFAGLERRITGWATRTTDFGIGG